MITIKHLSTDFNIKITRFASGESMILHCETHEKWKAVESAAIELFKAEDDIITVVNEAGNLVKRISPNE